MKVPFKQIIVVDFETRWDSKTYTLRKLTTEEYIRHENFKVFGMSYGFVDLDYVWSPGDDPKAVKQRWLSPERLTDWVSKVDWESTAVVAHNAQFDVSILTWKYGVRPAFIFDTLSMSRAVNGTDAKNSLEALAERYMLPPKGKAIHSTDGLVDLPPNIEAELAEYCCHDSFLCAEVFKRLLPGYPVKELRLIDMTVRMYTEAVLRLDNAMLTKALAEDNEKRAALLQRLNIAESELASNDKFALVLGSLGVVPPTKISPTTKKTVFAFAKTDAAFQAMLNSEDENVALLCEGRLAVKSTQARTRAQRFIDISTRGTLPVPLSYYGAHTGRWTASKGSSINVQNLKRGSFLRKAIMAPEGYTLGVVDLSQIEPRVLAWLADYDQLLDIFRSGQDAYASFGAQMFGIPGMTTESHPALRQSAKSALLGCGYGLGWASFSAQLLTGFLGAPPIRYDAKFARSLGVTAEDIAEFLDWQPYVDKLLLLPRNCSFEEMVIHCVATKRIVDKYRREARAVEDLWGVFGKLILTALYKGEVRQYKNLTFQKGAIILPNGMSLKYPDLQYTLDEKGRHVWTYGKDGKPLYGGKVVENVTQALARCVMTDGMLRINPVYRCVLTVHDEAVSPIPEEEGETGTAWMVEQMTVEPSYMRGIPLAAEAGFAVRYGDAK